MYICIGQWRNWNYIKKGVIGDRIKKIKVVELPAKPEKKVQQIIYSIEKGCALFSATP